MYSRTQYAVRGTAGYMYYSRHSPLGGGGYGSAQGEGVTGEDHTQEACHGVIYQGVIPSTPS
jgi:hypothetical protein